MTTLFKELISYSLVPIQKIIVCISLKLKHFGRFFLPIFRSSKKNTSQSYLLEHRSHVKYIILLSIYKLDIWMILCILFVPYTLKNYWTVFNKNYTNIFIETWAGFVIHFSTLILLWNGSHIHFISDHEDRIFFLCNIYYWVDIGAVNLMH